MAVRFDRPVGVLGLLNWLCLVLLLVILGQGLCRFYFLRVNRFVWINAGYGSAGSE